MSPLRVIGGGFSIEKATHGEWLNFAIQNPNGKIEYGGKTAPYKIGDLQTGGGKIDGTEGLYHPNHQCNEQKKPKEGGKIPMQSKEKDTPKEIYDQLEGIYLQSRFFLWGVRLINQR